MSEVITIFDKDTDYSKYNNEKYEKFVKKLLNKLSKILEKEITIKFTKFVQSKEDDIYGEYIILYKFDINDSNGDILIHDAIMKTKKSCNPLSYGDYNDIIRESQDFIFDYATNYGYLPEDRDNEFHNIYYNVCGNYMQLLMIILIEYSDGYFPKNNSRYHFLKNVCIDEFLEE